jgi:hypothetical protein
MSTYTNLTIPKIVWWYDYSKTLSFGYGLDNVITYSSSDENSQFALLQNASEYSWIINTFYTLEADVRWIPYNNTTNPIANGWNTTNGWREFLEFGRAKNPFRFYPDKDNATYITSYLVEPINGTHGLEIDGTRNVRLVIRNNITPYTGY